MRREARGRGVAGRVLGGDGEQRAGPAHHGHARPGLIAVLQLRDAARLEVGHEVVEDARDAHPALRHRGRVVAGRQHEDRAEREDTKASCPGPLVGAARKRRRKPEDAGFETENGAGVEAAPFTTTSTWVMPSGSPGTTTRSSEGVADITSDAAPAKRTVVPPAGVAKPRPRRVTISPGAARAGVASSSRGRRPQSSVAGGDTSAPMRTCTLRLAPGCRLARAGTRKRIPLAFASTTCASMPPTVTATASAGVGPTAATSSPAMATSGSSAVMRTVCLIR